MDSVMQKHSKNILLPVYFSILLFFLSCHVYFPSIDRKALFLFCNVILLFITTHDMVEVDETTKTDANPITPRWKSSKLNHVLPKREQVVPLEKPESDDAGSPCDDDSVEDGEEEDVSMIFKISEVEEDQQRDELREKIEAFIENAKRQRRMEIHQDNV